MEESHEPQQPPEHHAVKSGTKRKIPKWVLLGVPILVVLLLAGLVFAITRHKLQPTQLVNTNQNRTQSSQTANNNDPSINPVQQTYASCTTSTVLDTAPASHYSWLVPLGNIAPPGHVFPTDHLYFNLTRSGTADQPYDVTPVV